MYSPASPGALSPDVPPPFARVEGVGDRRDNVGRITFYVMAMVKGTVPVQINPGGARGGRDTRDTRTNTDITLVSTHSDEPHPVPNRLTNAHAQPSPHCVTFRYTLNLLFFARAASGAAGASLGVISNSPSRAAGCASIPITHYRRPPQIAHVVPVFWHYFSYFEYAVYRTYRYPDTQERGEYTHALTSRCERTIPHPNARRRPNWAGGRTHRHMRHFHGSGRAQPEAPSWRPVN